MTQDRRSSSLQRWYRGLPQVVCSLAVVMLLASLGSAARDGTEARVRKDIEHLASDKLEGRGVQTKGINLAADYIASEFKKAGLKPGAKGNYFQPFTMKGSARLESPNTVRLNGPLGQTIDLKVNKNFRPLGLSGAGKLSGPIVFVGYGATGKEISYDDYKGIDVKNKVVMLIRRVPRTSNTHTPFDGKNKANHESLITKMANAELHKAAAVILVNDRSESRRGDPLITFAYTARSGRSVSIPVVHIQRSIGNDIVQSSLGMSLKELEEDIDRNLKPRSAPLKGWTADLEINVKRPRISVKNVIGVLEGAGPHAEETVVIGAHYDHLGYGGRGSLAKGSKAVHNGADDNASGTVTIIELARRFGEMKNRQGRRLVFIAFSAEESGLLGSAHYCRSPEFPLKDTVAMVNLDMVGRVSKDAKTKKDKLIVYGTGTSKSFDKLIDSLNNQYQFQMKKIASGFGPSDHASFYQKKVPVFHFFTGTHKDYHRPSDTADKVNIEGVCKVCNLVDDLVAHLSTVKERPQYVKVKGSVANRPYRGRRIGIRPSYGDEGDGVLLSGVSEGGPAAKAGLKAGDRIVEVGGKPVKSLETYMVQMARFKKGQPVIFGVLRKSKKLKLKVIPE